MLGIEGGYPMVPLITYTPYVLPLALLAALVSAAFRQWAALGMAGLASLGLALVIAPRALGGDTAHSGDTVTVMSANVLAGSGDPEELLELARERKVQILAVQELTPEFAEDLERLGVRAQFPHSVLEAREGVSGTGIYSVFPARALPPIESPFVQVHALLGARARFDVTSVHPVPPTSPGSVTRWENGMDALPEPSQDSRGTLLLGDFNSTLDNSRFRELLDQGYTDAAEQTGHGLTATWPSLDKPLRYLPVTIDHLLYDEQMAARDYEVLDLAGSDHKVVVAVLVLGS